MHMSKSLREKRARNKKSFSARLKQLRLASKLSQTELSYKLGAGGANVISRWERGRNLPPLEYLQKIALMFGVSVEDLIGED